MTERQVLCFLTLAKTLNFNETAQKLYMSQPAVTQSIHALEKTLGCTLFTRTKKDVSLTRAGIDFYQDAAEWFSYTNQIIDRAKKRNAAYAIQRDLSYMLPLQVMPKIIQQFHKQHPDILIRLLKHDGISQNRQAFYQKNDISVAFSCLDEEIEGFEFTELYQGNFCCLLSLNHPLASKDTIQFQDLKDETIYIFKEELQSMFHNKIQKDFLLWYKPSQLMTVNNFYEATIIAGAGYGIPVIPDIGTIHSDNCVRIPFVYDQPYRIGLFTKKNSPPDILDFCSIAKEICANEPFSPVIF